MKLLEGDFYRTLTDNELGLVHESSVRILWDVGFEVTYPPLLQLLEENGVLVDHRMKRAYLSPRLISQCMKQAPSEFTYYGQEEGKELHLGGNNVYFGTGGKALYVMEEGHRRRPAVSRDIAYFARLADKLAHVDFYIIPVHSHDVNINFLDINDFYRALCNTGRPVMGGIYSRDGLRRVVELAGLLAGGFEALQRRPFVGFITSITSPLKLEDDRAEILVEVARSRLPLVVSTAPISGATAPVTLAGTLVLQNAEALLGVVLSQLVSPGTPVFYSAVPCSMDMRSGSFLIGSVESGLMNAALSQMARYYRLPAYLTVGAADSKLPDAQAAHETTTNCLLGALAGGHFLHQMFGFLDGALTISYAQFVIDNDIVGSCLRALRGIEVSPETMAVDVIAEVGPGGSYLSHKHTLRHLRRHALLSRIELSREYQVWKVIHAKESWQKAEELAMQLRKKPLRKYIPEGLEEEIRQRFPELELPVE